VISRLGMSRDDLRHIERLARDAFPYEACGLLVGLSSGARNTAPRVTRIAESANLAAPKARDRFEIDPKVQFAVLRELRGREEAIIGVFHSHPNGRSEPSPRDLEDANDPDLVWLVTAVTPEGTATSRAFKLAPDAGRFEEIPIEFEEPA
jgi:proteasome lid subunit RPN8/RPN11